MKIKYTTAKRTNAILIQQVGKNSFSRKTAGIELLSKCLPQASNSANLELC